MKPMVIVLMLASVLLVTCVAGGAYIAANNQHGSPVDPYATDTADETSPEEQTVSDGTEDQPASDEESSSDREELQGKYLQYSVSGSKKTSLFRQVVIPVTGTMKTTYLYYDEDKDSYYAMSEKTGNIPGGAGRSFYWTNDGLDEFTETKGDVTTIQWGDDTVTVQIWTLTYTAGHTSVTETQYVGTTDDDWWVAYKVEYESAAGYFGSESYSIVYELEEYGDADTVALAAELTDLRVYTDEGISYGVDGTMEIGETVVLTASAEPGYTFGGWYDEEGNLLSGDASYRVKVEVGTMAIVARNGSDSDISVADYSQPFSVQGADGLTGTWTIGSLVNGDLADITCDADGQIALDPGYYEAFFAGEDSEGNAVYLYRDIHVGGTQVTRTYSWTYDGHEYSVTLDIDVADYMTFVNALNVSERCDTWSDTNSYDGDLAFVNTVSTQDDAYLQKLAQYFTAVTAGMSQQKAADVVLSFVQDAIPYQYDSTTYSAEEYWQFPLETLYLGTGDCEDTSILFAAICKQMGWDAALFLLYGHMAAGVTLDEFTDETPGRSSYLSSKTNYCTSSDGTRYYYCETTGDSDSYHVGDVPSGQSLYAVMPVGTIA